MNSRKISDFISCLTEFFHIYTNRTLASAKVIWKRSILNWIRCQKYYGSLIEFWIQGSYQLLHYLATTGAAIIVLSQRPKNAINKPPPSGIRERIHDRRAAVIRCRYCLAVLNIFVEPSAWCALIKVL